MQNNPIINPYYIAKAIPDEGAVFLSELSSVVFYEPIYMALIELMDGLTSVDAIVHQLSGRFKATDIYYALFMLKHKKYVIEGCELNQNAKDIYWLTQNTNSKKADQILNQQKVSMVQYGEVELAPLKEILLSSGMTVVEQGAIDIVVTDSYLRPELSVYNERALKEQRPWILIKPNGLEPWIGPLFVPNQTGCYQCLYYYLIRNNRIENFVAKKTNENKGFFVTSLANFPTHFNLAYNLAVSLLNRYLTSADESLLLNHLLSLDTNTFELKKHIFIKREHCSTCTSSAKNSVFSFPNLQDNQLIHFNDGGYRTVPPEETIKRYQHLISPITGIISTLHGCHEDKMYVYLTGQNHAFPITHLTALKKNLRQNCSGKGINEAQAKASAICEALERYSGEFQGNEPYILSSFNELAEDAVHPNSCMLYSEKQYENRTFWNKIGSMFTRVPVAFDPDAKIAWSPVWSLSKQKVKYLPTEYLYYYYHNKENPVFCHPDSNGSAAGNTLEEAMLQGFFELVERDAVAIWWYNRLHMPGVLLESFSNPYFLQLQKHYHSQQRELWVLDLTNDLNIPTFVAVSRKTNASKEAIIFGFGCHFDANIALSRALTEMNQMLTAVNQMKDEAAQSIDPIFYDWLEHALVSEQNYLMPKLNVASKKLSDYPVCNNVNLIKNLQRCQEIVEKNNIELLVLNQTRPEIALSVVKVLCPGLRHFWARFAKGRLYDVPVKMGWQDLPLLESELNPIPIFF